MTSTLNLGEGVHGALCHARTYPMRCKYCGDPVYYFTCDHGLKIFFDELGAPWQEHACTGYLKAVTVDDALEAPTRPRKKPARQIDKKYADRLLAARARPHAAEIVRTEPYRGAAVQEGGIVREVIADVDLPKKLKVAPDSIAATQLGELSKGRYDQVTIHTGALAGEDHFSYTFFINQKLLRGARVLVGDYVHVHLRALTILGNKKVWVCDKLSGLFG